MWKEQYFMQLGLWLSRVIDFSFLGLGAFGVGVNPHFLLPHPIARVPLVDVI